MKFLLVFAVLFIAIWIWRKNRRDEMQSRPPPPAPPRKPPTVAAPQAMVRCAHCGLHLPATDALTGPDGALYCSAAHRQAGAG